MRCGAGSTPATSGGDRLAALAAAGSQDGAAGAGAHAQAEAVRLGATTVVRLERTLAHEFSYGFGDPPGRWASATIGHQHARDRNQHRSIERGHATAAATRGTASRYGPRRGRVKPPAGTRRPASGQWREPDILSGSTAQGRIRHAE